jgi:hypothetical protein
MFAMPRLAAGPLGEAEADADGVVDGTDGDGDGTAADADPVADDAGEPGVPAQPDRATTMAIVRQAARAAACRRTRAESTCPVIY